MKRKLSYLFIFVLLISGCAIRDDKNIPVSSIMEKIKTEVSFKNSSEQNLTELSVAKKYGLSISEIEEGLVYSTTDINEVGEIILIKAKSTEDVQNIQRALNLEIERLSNTWEDISDSEYQKIINHVLKTRGKYILLSVTDDSKKIEKVFDNMA